MIRYTYISAATESYPSKQGVVQIMWEDNGSEDQSKWSEITREYLPEDPRNKPSPALAAVLSAKPEEIEKIRKILGI